MKNIFKILLLTLLVLSCNTDPVENISVDLKTAKIVSDDGHRIKYDDGYEIVYDDFPTEAKTTDWLRYAAVEGYTIKGTTITAGTGEEIEIFGSGFGNTQGIVSIGLTNIGDNLNIINEFKAWTDTYIKVRVRSGARSGNVVVTLADKVTKITVGSVTVKYSVYNATQQYDLYPYWEPVRFQHSANADGVIVWHFITGGYSATLKDNFRKGLAEWNTKTGINWVLGDDVPAPLTADIGRKDGIYTVTIGPSPGAAHYGVSSKDCGIKNTMFVYDAEIVFDESQTYTTILHELGHATGLGHTAGVGGIMSPSGGSAIGTYDIEGAKNQVSFDISKQIGCAPNMIALVQPTVYTYYKDVDSDGFGGSSYITSESTTVPSGYVKNNSDCNDNNALINPNATEIKGNGIDENCNGMRDDRIKGRK